MRIACAAFALLLQTIYGLAADVSPFQLTNKATGFCLVKTNNHCHDIRWTTGDRLLVQEKNKCLGVQGKNVGSEVNLYDCDETSELQKWECKNETLLAIQGQELYIELSADNTAVLSRTTGPNNHLIIQGTSSGACARTYRELFAIGGNAAGKPCMFPFLYKDQWYSNCTTFDSSVQRLWCAVETKYQSERWGYCPSTSKEDWNKHPTTGTYYQLNTQSALTWPQAEVSCKQQGASLLSINDPHEQAYVTALLGQGGITLWIGMILDPQHGWKWSNGRPYRYMKWDSGHPLPDPGHNCAVVNPAVQYYWQSSSCSKKLGYICYSKGAEETPTQAVGGGFCSSPWIPYNGHCFHLNSTQETWSDAQRQCRNEGGDLVSIRNVEDQSFVISQLGYTSTDELWIGLNDRRTEGLFDWIDHATVSFTSWEFGKPAVNTDIQDCVLISGENGNWADRVCEEKHGFICMKMSASKPTGDVVPQNIGCKSGWRRHGSYCYFIGTESKTFDQAKDDCKNSDAYLADVSTVVDNAFLVSLVGLRSEKYFWLGLSNQEDIDEFIWTNTVPVKFTQWNAEMPGHQQGCVAMKTGIFAGLWDVLPCTNKEKYICKHLAEGAHVTPAPPTLIPPRCASGWSPLGSRKQCSKLFSPNYDKRSWYGARDYCRAIGGDLLSIHSPDELHSLEHSHYDVWIGLNAPGPDTSYVWSDGSPLQFQHWLDGEPNNKNKVGSCAQMDLNRMYGSGSWRNVHCEKENAWLCQIRAGITPNPPPAPVPPDYNRTSDGWFEWNGSQYYFTDFSMSMEEARQFCQRRHSDLVSINSEAEWVFLWKRITKSYNHFWIGMTVDLDGTFAWMDGSPVVFQMWDINEPDFRNNDENCALMTSGWGLWRDYNCGFAYSSICKRSGSPPANATVAPTVLPSGGCPQNWTKLDSKCYNIINKREKWEGARTQCRNMGGNLASIVSRHVQVFLATKMAEAPTTELWTGLHCQGGGSFYWTDGQRMRYNNWGSDSSRTSFRPDRPWGSNRFEHFRPIRNELRECAVISTDTQTGIGKWLKRNCNNTYGYVCHRNVDPSLPDSPKPTALDGYVKILNDSIKVVAQKMDWDAAQKHCKKDGANLASLRNEWSQLYVELMTLDLKAPVWIGLNGKQMDGYYRYVEGWRMTTSNWDRMEPSGQPCVYVGEEGKWHTTQCYENMASVCMKSTEVPPTDSSEYPGFCPEDPDTLGYPHSRYTQRHANTWIPFKGYCYLFVTQRNEWPDASASCARHDGTLASIGNPDEQQFIANNIQLYRDSIGSFWIGLYKTHKGLWRWLDKTVVDYTNWNINGLNSFGQSYGLVRTYDGRWGQSSMHQREAYICKTRKVLQQIPPTTVSSTMADSLTRSHIALPIVMVICVTALVAVIIILLFKRSGVRLPIPKKLTTFENPLFSEQHRTGLVDTNKLVANTEGENSGRATVI